MWGWHFWLVVKPAKYLLSTHHPKDFIFYLNISTSCSVTLITYSGYFFFHNQYIIKLVIFNSTNRVHSSDNYHIIWNSRFCWPKRVQKRFRCKKSVPKLSALLDPMWGWNSCTVRSGMGRFFHVMFAYSEAMYTKTWEIFPIQRKILHRQHTQPG